MSRSWLFLTAPTALVALALLSWTVASLLRTVRGSVVATVPILAEQRVVLDRPGEIVLNVEGPFLGRGAAGLRFGIARADTAGEFPIPIQPVLFRTEVSSASRARLELYRFTVPLAGTYVVRISGVDPRADYSADAVVFTRPFGAAIIFHVLSLIVLGGVLIGSLVISGLALTGRHVVSSSLESAIAHSAAVVRARTIVRGGSPRYEVLETVSGSVPGQIAGAGQPDGLIVDTRAAMADGYRPVADAEVVLLLPFPAPLPGAERSSVVLVAPIAILPIVDGRAIYAPREATTRRELTLTELRHLAQP